MCLDLEVHALVERLDLHRELVEGGLRLLRQLEGIDLEAHAVLGERLLEDDLALREDAGFLGAGERVLGGLADLLDLLALLLQLARGRLLALLELLDLGLDRLDLLVGLGLRFRDFLVDVVRRRARASDSPMAAARRVTGVFMSSSYSVFNRP